MENFRDTLKVEGILFKGFGIIPKFVMLDIDLSIDSKAIYLYLCSFAGSGEISFPSRDKILNDLKISKKAYYNHYNPLIKQGYIKVEREHYKDEKTGQYRKGKNIYTLVLNPKKFKEEKNNIKNSKSYSQLKLSSMKSLGYGTIPKAVMIDQRLHRKSKAIYGYFTSFAGNGDCAFPKVPNILYHLQISEKTYYKYYKELTNLNYITAEQRHIEGKLGVNDYYLNELPDEGKVIHIDKNSKLQTSKKEDIEECIENKPFEQTSKKEDIEKEDIQKEDIQKEDIQKEDIITTNSFNINSIYYNQSINQGEKKGLNDRLNTEHLETEVLRTLKEKRIIPYNYIKDPIKMDIAIKILTEYQNQLNWFKINKDKSDQVYFNVFKLFNEALIEMLTTPEKMFLNNSYVTYAKVYDKLIEQIDINDKYMSIGNVISNSINDYTEASLENEIRNPKKYMKAVIWNCLVSGDIKMVTDLRRNFGI